MTALNLLMQFTEISAVYSENFIKLINTLCGSNVALLKVKADGTHSYYQAAKGE
jgi:hypothetical protein